MKRTALIVEPKIAVARSLRQVLEGQGYGVAAEAELDDAWTAVSVEQPQLLFVTVAPDFDGEGFCRRAKKEWPGLKVVLLYRQGSDGCHLHGRAAGADLVLEAPVSSGTLRASLLAVEDQSARDETLEGLRRENRQLAEARLTRRAKESTDSELRFFKRMLLLEVRRARRYRYPLSVLSVEIDGWASRRQALSDRLQKVVLGDLLRAVTQEIRDVDLSVPAAGDRALVFLTHTPQAGAVIVAERIRRRVGRLQRVPGLTASLGVASVPGNRSPKELTFGLLIREAGDALRRAQAAGGDRIESVEIGKRDRVSMG